jgi:hypothetical protein
MQYYTLFLGYLLGFYLFLTSLAMLVHKERFKKTINEFLSDQPLLTFSGGIGTFIGLILVLSHNVWTFDWSVVITLVGWAVLLQGLMRTFLPQTFAHMVRTLQAKVGFSLLSWFWLLVGSFLIWGAYTAA